MVELINNQLPEEPQTSSSESGVVVNQPENIYEEQTNDYVAVYGDSPVEKFLREQMLNYFEINRESSKEM